MTTKQKRKNHRLTVINIDREAQFTQFTHLHKKVLVCKDRSTRIISTFIRYF